MLSSFHLSGHTLEFDPQTQKLDPHYTAKQKAPKESSAQQLSFEWSHLKVCPQVEKSPPISTKKKKSNSFHLIYYKI